MSKGLCTEVKKATAKSWTMKIDGQDYWTTEDPTKFEGQPVEFDYTPSQWKGKTNNWVVKDSLKGTDVDAYREAPEVVHNAPTGNQFSNELMNKTLNTCMMGAVELTKSSDSPLADCVKTFKELFKVAKEV